MIDESLLKSAVAGKDGFTWWIGRVADSSTWFNENATNAKEGKTAQRCKVRIIGYHPWDGTSLAENDLPWAHVMMDPITGSGQGGLGDTMTLTGGETAVGFFLDGEEAQQPVIMGLLHRSSEVKNSISEAEMQSVKSSNFKPFTGHPQAIRKQHGAPPTKKSGVDTQGVAPSNSPVTTGAVNFASLAEKTYGESGANIFTGSASDVNWQTGEGLNIANMPSNLGKTNFFSGEDSVHLRDFNVNWASLAAEKTYTKKYRKPSGCGDNPTSEMMGQIQDFITMVDGLEQTASGFIDPIRNTVVDMEQQAKKVASMVGSVVKGIINNLRDGLIKKVVSLFSIFGALQKKVNPADQITGPAMWKGAKGILGILFCIFEKVMGMLLDFLSNMFKNMVGQVVNGPVCAAEQFVDGILAKVFDLIEDIAGPVLQGIDWLTGGLSNITEVLGNVSSLARQLFSFLSCDDIKCHEETEWESGNSASIQLPKNDWASRLSGVNAFKGIQNNLQSILNDIDVNTDTGLLAQTNVDGSNLLGILQATDALTGGNSAGLADKGLGSIESAIAGISLFGNGNNIFNACGDRMRNPQTQDDLIDMPIGYKYHTCIPPVAKIKGKGSGAELKAVVGSDGKIFSVEVIRKGSGYSKGSTSIAIIDKTRHGKGAQAKPVIDSDGSIKEIIVTIPGKGYCGGSGSGSGDDGDVTIQPYFPGGGVGIITSVVAIKPGIGYTGGDSVVIFDPTKGIDRSVGGGTTNATINVTPGNGSIVDVQIPTDFRYEFTTRAGMLIDSKTGFGAKLIPIMKDRYQSSVDDAVRPLVGITSVIDCPTDEHSFRGDD